MNPTPQSIAAIAIGTLLGAFLWKSHRIFGAIGGGALGFGVSQVMAQQAAAPVLPITDTGASQIQVAVGNK
jgi:uncharacterized membrane protein YdjX (TVP38/TMEM64 family)